MTARIDTIVKSSQPALATAEQVRLLAPEAKSDAKSDGEAGARDAERRRREALREERVARWRDIREAGGVDGWVKAQLQQKGLWSEELAPPTTDRERAQYKAKKKAEAEERRALKRLAWEAYRASHILHLGAGVHWEDDPDRDRFDLEHREARARDNGLPDWKGAEDLAAAMGLPVARLRWLSYHREVDRGSHYRAFTIPKRDGTPRTIHAPKRDLKAAQRFALRQVAEKLPVHSAAHGFLPGRSIATNAAAHAGADVVVKLDIEGFFPTITWRRVKGLLRKAGLREGAATLLSLMCTEAPREIVSFRGGLLHVATGPRALPQGAPSSPALTNAICLRLDRRLAGLARALGFRYTRYADDLTFSWRPPEAEAPGPSGERPRPSIGALLAAADDILRGEGFRMNRKKTRVLRAGARQQVTGLVVNEAPNAETAAPARVPRETLRRLRAAIHNREAGRPGKEGETLESLRGMAAFVHMTDPKKGRELLDRIARLEMSHRVARNASRGG